MKKTAAIIIGLAILFVLLLFSMTYSLGFNQVALKSHFGKVDWELTGPIPPPDESAHQGLYVSRGQRVEGGLRLDCAGAPAGMRRRPTPLRRREASGRLGRNRPQSPRLLNDRDGAISEVSVDF